MKSDLPLSVSPSLIYMQQRSLTTVVVYREGPLIWPFLPPIKEEGYSMLSYSPVGEGSLSIHSGEYGISFVYRLIPSSSFRYCTEVARTMWEKMSLFTARELEELAELAERLHKVAAADEASTLWIESLNQMIPSIKVR